MPWLNSQFSFYVCLGGPKLRKWYGAPDLLPKDGSAVEEDDESSGILIPKLIGSLCPYFFQGLVLLMYRGGRR